MKINEITSQAETTSYVEQVQKPIQTGKNQAAQSQPAQDPQTDTVDLSDQSKEMKTIYTVQQMAPDIRTERVDEVKKLVDQNSYQVDSDAVADKMIQESILDLNR
jgi:flagellar biosynthesis anti-sigma factor FlgM